MKTVLIIESEPSELKRLKNIVEVTGNFAIKSHTILEGVGYFSKYHPDMVITGTSFTDGDGLNVINLIRTIDHHTPILFMTDHFEQNRTLQIAAMELGATQTLDKPSAYQFIAKSILNNLGREQII